MKKITQEEIYHALEESVAIQSHYAEILNSYDNGQRLRFTNADEWIRRLREIKERKGNG
jgi:hypothetical protein